MHGSGGYTIDKLLLKWTTSNWLFSSSKRFILSPRQKWKMTNGPGVNEREPHYLMWVYVSSSLTPIPIGIHHLSRFAVRPCDIEMPREAWKRFLRSQKVDKNKRNVGHDNNQLNDSWKFILSVDFISSHKRLEHQLNCLRWIQIWVT